MTQEGKFSTLRSTKNDLSSYAMQTNIGALYLEMATSARPEIAEAFNRPAKFEKGLKAKVFNTARDLGPALKA